MPYPGDVTLDHIRKDPTRMMTSSPSNPTSKLFRIGLHLACMFVHPITHLGFHLSGIAREFRFY